MQADRPTATAPTQAIGEFRKTLFSPLLLLAGAVLLCAVLLTRPLLLPLGPMYWDLTLYLDAANRIESGQTPLIDFITPVGPLGYWLFAWLGDVFPRAQPLLLAQWSLFLVTAPPMALILREADRRSRATAFALLLPYLVFQILPINVEHYSFFPGTDGFGIYNRQVSIVLYVLVSALTVLRDRRALIAVLVWCILALLLIKITGFLAGGVIVAFAMLVGRIDIRASLVAAVLGVVALLVLEIWNGLVSAYVESIVALVAINAGGILQRFLQAGSLHLDIVAAGGALIVTLIWLERRDLFAGARAVARRPSWHGLQQLLDRDVVWLAVVMAAGLFFETQNTGGQAFIFIWPVLLCIVIGWAGSGRRGAFLVLALVAATAIPPVETVLQRAGRAMLAQTGYMALPHTHLGRLGQVSQNVEVVGRAAKMQVIYAASPDVLNAMAEQKILPSQSLYSELDFQLGWLMAVDAGIGAILAHEAQSGTRFETIMSLNFANPFPALMGRTGVRHIAIGADPFRAVETPDAAAIAAVAAADLVLLPQCPITVANEALRGLYAPALAGRREIALGSCWKGFVRG
ncbi:hypothetical protein [Bosea sp. Root381]|uniref:hypothetical protein n=1 Tax=Bosea sp. Root381 TaxID=1736524 RepID=UPI000AD6FAAA|nr:hypothetical protein [Bosea sp. Root381]